MEQGLAGMAAGGKGGIVAQGKENEVQQGGAGGLEHAGEEADEDGRARAEACRKQNGLGVSRVQDQRNRVVQGALFGPAGGEFGMREGGGGVESGMGDVGGTLEKELAEGGLGGFGKGSVGEGGEHVFEPGGALGGADVKTGVRFPEAQPPAVLRLSFVSTQELDEESGEFFDGAAEALAGKEGAEGGILPDAGVEVPREDSGAGLSAYGFEQGGGTAHAGLYLGCFGKGKGGGVEELAGVEDAGGAKGGGVVFEVAGDEEVGAAGEGELEEAVIVFVGGEGEAFG